MKYSTHFATILAITLFLVGCSKAAPVPENTEIIQEQEQKQEQQEQDQNEVTTPENVVPKEDVINPTSDLQKNVPPVVPETTTTEKKSTQVPKSNSNSENNQNTTPTPAPEQETEPETEQETQPENNSNQVPDSTPKPENQTKPPVTSSSLSAFEKKVVELTNAERTKAGLNALTIDTTLSNVARTKSQDMLDNNYFSHTSPTYGSPFDMMKEFGVAYITGGENIAQGQTTPEEVVTAWMNSSGHRANILSPVYNYIGVGYVSNGNYWTQMFISK